MSKIYTKHFFQLFIASILIVGASSCSNNSEYKEAMTFYDSISTAIDSVHTLDELESVINEYADRSSRYTTDIATSDKEKEELSRKSDETAQKLASKLENLSKINGIDIDGIFGLDDEEDDSFSVGF
ncbi:MAG: hypothetical protein M0P12_08120 [Paludibacteraceae bacterium]|nr:hypothetical protein [Paludibacteraceae bacterium]